MGFPVSISNRSFRSTAAALTAGLLTTGLLTAGCDAAIEDPVTFEEYATELAAICGATTERLLALPPAPEQIAVADLATRAAEILDDEAARADRLDVPDEGGGDAGESTDPAGDHRAFVRNTREQAAVWRDIATDADDLATDTELIAQLVGGRNELVRTMGVEGCVRGGL